MVPSEKPPVSLAGVLPRGRMPGLGHNLWRALLFGARWGNLLYVAACLVSIGVLVGLGSAPWGAYLNVLFVIVVAGGTALLNVRAARGADLGATLSGLAVVSNLVCLKYLVAKPEYSISVLKPLVAVVPLLNIVVLTASWIARWVTAGHAGRRLNGRGHR